MYLVTLLLNRDASSDTGCESEGSFFFVSAIPGGKKWKNKKWKIKKVESFLVWAREWVNQREWEKEIEWENKKFGGNGGVRGENECIKNLNFKHRKKIIKGPKEWIFFSYSSLLNIDNQTHTLTHLVRIHCQTTGRQAGRLKGCFISGAL